MLAAFVHHFKIKTKRGDFNSDTVIIHIFIKGHWYTHNITTKVYEKEPLTLPEVIKLVEKLNSSHQITATLSSPMVNMMSNDNSCFVCGKKGHIHHHCPDAQCYNCNGFGHFAKDCQEKITPSGTPDHHDRLHSPYVTRLRNQISLYPLPSSSF